MNKLQYPVRIIAVLAAINSYAVIASADGFPNQAASTRPADYATGEKELLETLRTAAPEDKALACKQLAIHGSKEAVPDLAKLLADPQLASWSRTALEAIPDPAADAALLKAAETLNGRLLVGAINSLGVRRTAAAVDQLAGRLADADTEVASAAAVALGCIGDAKATSELRKSLASSPAAVRSAVAEGLILCAERLMADGKPDEAAAIYDAIRETDLPQQRLLEATRGAILARGADGVPLLIATLHAQDKRQFQLGLQTIREMQFDRTSSTTVMAELLGTSPPRAALVLTALADRPGFVVTPQVLQTATFGDKGMRLAALGVIGRLGDSASIDTLLRVAADQDAALAAAANGALASLPSEEVSAEITSRLSGAEGKTLVSLLAAIGQRRIEATAEISKLLANSDVAIRHAAIGALGETIGPQELRVLVAQLLSPPQSEDAAVAARALRAACVRMPDRDACAAELAAAMPKASDAAKLTLIDILGAMGGPKALETIAAAVKGGDVQFYDAGTRTLGQWMTVDAGPALLAMAQDPANKKFQVRALRGYLRLARQFDMPSEDRAAMCEQALAAATRVDEQKLALEVLARYPSARALDIVLGAKKLPGLRDDAGGAAMIIVQKLIEQGADADQLLAKIGEKPVKVEIVKAVYGSGATVRDVTQDLQQQVRGLPLITLSAASFNKSFGGDPAPNMTKELKVQYRIDGKAGEASFAENSVIILPMPK